uniref:Pyrin domain-containing protein n=1 Tax=Mola mola TaxID=94237 RepID=A0A3Q3XAE4_MOLML
MAPKTIKNALLDTLEDLTEQDFNKFCHQLLDRREEPRVTRRRVEGKDRLDVVDVLVSTFTEHGALNVAVEVLTQIACNQEAHTLGEATGVLPPAAGPQRGAASHTPPGGGQRPPGRGGRPGVDFYRARSSQCGSGGPDSDRLQPGGTHPR